MNLFQSLLYGCVSGITEFLPISSLAHQQLMLKMFGVEVADPLQSLFVHIGLMIAVLIGCSGIIDQLRRGYQTQRQRRKSFKGSNNAFEWRFIKNAVLPMILMFFVLYRCINIGGSLLWIALFSLINCLIMFAESRMMQGNKTEQTVSILDSILVGASGALSVLPGISRISVMLATSTACGIDHKKRVGWVLLLSIPALLFYSVTDILSVISTKTAVFGASFLPALLSGVTAFICGYFGILLMKSVSNHDDRSGIAFYSLGVALFSLIMYLMVV